MSHATAHLLRALAALGRMAAANEIGMVTATLDGVRDANDAFLRLTGYSRADLEAGRVHWRLLTAPEWTSMDDNAVAELRTTGSYGPHLKEYGRSDGTRLTVEVTAAVVSHEPLSWVTFVRDSTAEAAGETLVGSAERLAVLAAELARHVAVTDVTRTLTRHVRQAMGALGATIMEVDLARSRSGSGPKGCPGTTLSRWPGHWPDWPGRPWNGPSSTRPSTPRLISCSRPCCPPFPPGCPA